MCYKLGGSYSWGKCREWRFLADFDFQFGGTRKLGPFRREGSNLEDGSTRSAIGRIVTVYRMVQTVRSALEGKAHLDFTAERQDIPATPLALTFSEEFKCVISPQIMDHNDYTALENTTPCSS